MNKPKHILVLHCDQLRWDCLGYSGNPDIRTPNIDALARDSVSYTNHFTVYPICTPSRYSLWSGMYVHQHGAWSNRATLPGGYMTLPRLMRDNGFDTAAVGKMHFTPTYHDIGFSRMCLAEQNGVGRYEDDYHAELMARGAFDRVDLHHESPDFRMPPRDLRQDMFQAAPSDLPAELHSTAWTTRKALEELETWDDAPRMLMVGYIKPHHPFDPPHPYSELYDPARLTLPGGYTPQPFAWDMPTNGTRVDYSRMSEADFRQALAYYYSAITQIDEGIGQMLEVLRRKGLYQDTMIVFTSDHGEYLGQHHMLLKCNHLYESLVRIPLLIRYPGGPCGEDHRLCENIDVMPTVLEACGLPVPPSVQGESLLSGREKAHVFAEYQAGTDQSPCHVYMLRTARWKLQVRGTLEDGMLFDLEQDPWEMENRFHDPACREILAQLKAQLADTLLFQGAGKNHCNLSAPRLVPQEETDERAEGLKAFIRARW